MKTLLQMSLTGCYCVPVALAVRFILIKVLHSPRRYVYCLWLVVFLNLCLPISLRVPMRPVTVWLSHSSAFLSAETENGEGMSGSEAGNDIRTDNDAEVSNDAKMDDGAEAGFDAGTNDDAEAGIVAKTDDGAEAGVATETDNGAEAGVVAKMTENAAWAYDQITTLSSAIDRKAANVTAVILSWPGLFKAWLAGLFLVLLYQGIATFNMHRLFRTGRRVKGKERIYIVRKLPSPCLWGLFRPVICLPEGLKETELDYILCHERCHKRRGDHIAKWVLFLITAVHWFNPFVWLAYSFCCRDMEISCDEAVLRQADEDVRKAYAASLLKYAARQNGYLFAPLTFGEPSLRSRVSNILHYRKQGVFVCGAALAIVLLVGAWLLLRKTDDGMADAEGTYETAEGTDETAEAGKDEDGSTAQTWQSAYLEILYHLTDNLVAVYEPDGSDLRSDQDALKQKIYLGLHDFENDGTYELIAGDQFSIAVFTYMNGQTEKIADLYIPDTVWCINGFYFKDNSIGLICAGAGGSDFINFGYLDGEYLLGIYCEISGDVGTTVNGVKSAYDEVDRIYTLDYSKRSSDERREWIWLVYENEQWILRYQTGEEAVLDSDFDFDTVLW